MKKDDDLLSQLRMEELEKYNVSFNHKTQYTLRIYSKLKSIIEDTLDIQHYYDFQREGDMKRNLTMEVYHLCEALEFTKRELIDFAIENGYDGLIKSKKF